jgi:hypothetical protein
MNSAARRPFWDYSEEAAADGHCREMTTDHSDESLSEQSKGGKGPRVNNGNAPASIFLDPWLTAKGAPLVALVDHLMLITMPDTTGRTRSLRRDAAERRRFVMGNIAANLVHLALSPSHEPGSLLAVATAKTKATRYDRADYPQRMLAGTIEALESAGILTRHTCSSGLPRPWSRPPGSSP